jgi:RimJ/RimL family protein N-acetyltransferase
VRVRAAAPEEYGWLTARTGYQPGGDFRAIVAEAGRVRGLVGFDRWTPASVHMHVALDSMAAGRPLLHSAFAYVFGQCERRLARGEVRASNLRVIALALHLGFRQAHTVKDGWEAGDDLVLLEMRREECRWIGGSHG